MRPQECCAIHQPQTSGLDIKSSGCWSGVAEAPEILIAILCSIVTWEFTVQNDLGRKYGALQEQQQEYHLTLEEPTRAFLFHPSPGLMLGSCLVFGCCVSSFAQRRQSQDPLQFVVFLVVLGAAALVGYGLQASTNLILLGYLPSATCAAMTISISGHGLYRLSNPQAENGADEEKAQLLG
ncbi:hypothetical protein QBC35DRAFT_389333 [Podospora australis]|uniref:Uncharacterized protein n=1 Tax=Podospora australis TaxID=1536484 RepID=A0AAN6WP92_9PEZI|nr:hypothetical protein QBC35DRAFT_389333 [Podospora australis]